MRIDLGCRDIQGIETIADHHQIIQTLQGLSARPDPLSEAGTEEVVSHASVACRKKWKRV